MQSASGGFDGSRSWRMGLCAIAVFRTCLDAVAHGGNPLWPTASL
ncbi:hypothetical protein [Moorena bouillonii]|nr:hypothetical protein [Moorena bouillonii]